MATIDDAYRRAESEVEGRIAAWYQRFADNNGIVDMAEARRLLSSEELKEFRWTVEEYARHGRENGVTADWSKQLENASARFHITRLEALKLSIQQSAEVLFGNQLDEIDALMRKNYLGSYYHTAFTIQTGAGVGWDIAALNQGALKIALSRPWASDGRNFSDRIWTNKQALIAELQRGLTQSLLTGNTCDKTIDAIMKRFNVSRNQAERLVLTENAYILSAAQGDSYRANGVKKVIFVATLDDRTSEICRKLDGTVIDMKDYQPGETVPPLHPRCRSTTAPHYDDLAGIGERAARNPDTGKTYYVPREMKYEQWKQTFVDGGSKAGLSPAAPRDYDSTFAKALSKRTYDDCRDILAMSGTPEARAVWDAYEGDIGVADINEKVRQRCDWNASIHVDLSKSVAGDTWSKPAQTVFHECGHAIDMLAGARYGYEDGRYKASGWAHNPQGCYSVRYKSGLFERTIRDEVNALVNAKNAEVAQTLKRHKGNYDWLERHAHIGYLELKRLKQNRIWPDGESQYSKAMAYKAIEQEIRALPELSIGDLSDIIGGATEVKIQGGFGHSPQYWRANSVRLPIEAFADMYDCSAANPESLEAIRKYLPKSYALFLEMLGEIVK